MKLLLGIVVPHNHRAVNGLEALSSYFDAGPFDLILMDIRLPGLDGNETTMRIREKDKTVPIIAHTALAMEGDKERSLNAGCNAYIRKPIDRIELLQLIVDFIQKSGRT